MYQYVKNFKKRRMLGITKIIYEISKQVNLKIRSQHRIAQNNERNKNHSLK